MHGFGRRLHRSHHQPDGSRFELNDWFPVMFASIVMLGLWAGFNLDGLEILVPVGVGVTLYGAAYAAVHDGWIHRRVSWFDGRQLVAPRPSRGRASDPSRAATGPRSACCSRSFHATFAIGRWIA